jgi:hypothetical protein
MRNSMAETDQPKRPVGLRYWMNRPDLRMPSVDDRARVGDLCDCGGVFGYVRCFPQLLICTSCFGRVAVNADWEEKILAGLRSWS